MRLLHSGRAKTRRQLYLDDVTRFMARVVDVYSWKNRGTSYVRVSQFLGASAASLLHMLPHIHAYICTNVYTYIRTYIRVPAAACENHVKAKNTFWINCRVGIPRRCAEQNAAVASKAKRRREKKGNRMVDRSVGRSIQTERRWDGGGRVRSVSRKNANFSLRRRYRARKELVVARSDVVALLALCLKSWTWIVKTEKKEKDGKMGESLRETK